MSGAIDLLQGAGGLQEGLSPRERGNLHYLERGDGEKGPIPA